MTEQDVRGGRPLRAALLWLLTLLLMAALTPAVVPAEDDPAWKPVTVLYQSDVKGKIEPCG